MMDPLPDAIALLDQYKEGGKLVTAVFAIEYHGMVEQGIPPIAAATIIGLRYKQEITAE